MRPGHRGGRGPDLRVVGHVGRGDADAGEVVLRGPWRRGRPGRCRRTGRRSPAPRPPRSTSPRPAPAPARPRRPSAPTRWARRGPGSAPGAPGACRRSARRRRPWPVRAPGARGEREAEGRDEHREGRGTRGGAPAHANRAARQPQLRGHRSVPGRTRSRGASCAVGAGPPLERGRRQPSPDAGASCGVDLGHPGPQLLRRAGVVDDVRRDRQPVLPRGLRGHPCLGVLAGHAALLDHPRHLGRDRDVDHDDRVERTPPARSRSAAGCRGRRPPPGPRHASISAARARTRGWMIPSSTRRLASSANTIAPSAGSVQPAVGGEDVRPERLDHLGQPFGAGGHHLAGEHVGVDHDGAELVEDRRDGALARRHSPGESHAHAVDPSVRLHRGTRPA